MTTVYEQGRTDRAMCPVCYFSVRLAEGKFVEHTARPIRVPGQTAPPCRGTGRAVVAVS